VEGPDPAPAGQEQNKCRRSHHRLLHVEDVRNLQATRPAKPAKLPDRLRKSSACSRAETSRGVPAAWEEMLPTSRITAGAAAVATDEERRAARKAASQAQWAAMKQRLPSLEARLQELWQDVGDARRPAPTKVHLRATAAVDKQFEKAETLLRFAERHLEPTEGNLTEAEGYLRSVKVHLEAAEAQLAPAEAPPMSTVKAVAPTPSANAIENHRRALLSEVEQIEGAASREAQAKGWDLKVIEGPGVGMLEFTRDTLRDVDKALCDLKAAHHAACVRNLADEVSEVLDGTRSWSAQECTEFWEELDWELQAFSKVNTKLELYPMQTVERQAAHLRAERVEAAAHHARQVVERVLWDYDSTRRESQRLGLGYHQPICPEESWEQGGRQGVQADSVDDGGVDPREGCRRNATMRLQYEGPRRTRPGVFRSGLGTHRGRLKWIPEDHREESRPGTQRPGQANQLTWRGIGSESLSMSQRSCCTPSRSQERSPVDLDRIERPARLRGSWCSSIVSTRTHRDAKAMTTAGRNTRRTCTGMRTATWRWWRLSGLNYMECPARLQGSRCSREMSARAVHVAARERSAR
jgi:hypothetical protein